MQSVPTVLYNQYSTVQSVQYDCIRFHKSYGINSYLLLSSINKLMLSRVARRTHTGHNYSGHKVFMAATFIKTLMKKNSHRTQSSHKDFIEEKKNSYRTQSTHINFNEKKTLINIVDSDKMTQLHTSYHATAQ